jgi:hypothetical protein
LRCNPELAYPCVKVLRFDEYFAADFVVGEGVIAVSKSIPEPSDRARAVSSQVSEINVSSLLLHLIAQSSLVESD